MNNSMIKEPGYVLISDKGIASCGFDYHYDSPLLDGCRMGNLSPVMWAQSLLSENLQNELIQKNIAPVSNHEGERGDVDSMAEAFASMLLSQSPFKDCKEKNDEFICALYREMRSLNEAWSK
ncbi:hypothetical protein [Dongshaea marina]|uniref:hypothetical protein n=1 Tax=Dongshaea marina TaxID=2047966 RepID=UPI00131EF084|nr:hypothetical protein [Dongshaea marina]